MPLHKSIFDALIQFEKLDYVRKLKSHITSTESMPLVMRIWLHSFMIRLSTSDGMYFINNYICVLVSMFTLQK
jgi:hypothetical protein